jgi:hypothetical protein
VIFYEGVDHPALADTGLSSSHLSIKVKQPIVVVPGFESVFMGFLPDLYNFFTFKGDDCG